MKKYLFNIIIISLSVITLLIGAFVVFSSLTSDEKLTSRLILGITIIILSICAGTGGAVEVYLKSKGSNIK